MTFAAQKLRSFIAIALMLWCAGTGCIAVSYANANMRMSEVIGAHALPDGQRATASESMMRMHGGCAAHHRKSIQKSIVQDSPDTPEQAALPSSPTESGVMDCCPLKSGSIVVSTRSQTNDSASVLADAPPKIFSFSNATPAPLAVPLRLPDQNQTYLRGCVFLI